jgi:alpha-N-arabinofuranosidase
MRGTSLDAYVATPPSSSAVYTGETVPKFIQDLSAHTPDSKKLTKWIDVSTVLSSPTPEFPKGEIRIAILNKNADEEYEVSIVFPRDVNVREHVDVYEIWDEDLGAKNWFGEERVRTVKRTEMLPGEGGKVTYKLKKHSFQSE